MHASRSHLLIHDALLLDLHDAVFYVLYYNYVTNHEFPPFKILAVERLARKPLPSALGLLRNPGSNRGGWRARIGPRWNAVLDAMLIF